MKQKAPTGKWKAVANEAERTKVSAGLPATARVSSAHHCRYLPEASQFPAVSISRRLPSPADYTGRTTLARLFGTRGANWPREFRLTPFRPGRPREMGLVSALAWLVSSPVLGVPRMVHEIAKGVRRAASREQSLAEKLLALRMRLETREITEGEFQHEKALIEAARKEPVAKTPPPKRARWPKRKRRKED